MDPYGTLQVTAFGEVEQLPISTLSSAGKEQLEHCSTGLSIPAMSCRQVSAVPYSPL